MDINNDISRENIMNNYADMMDEVVKQPSSIKITDRWQGVVIDNEDPDKLGRVKIHIEGYYDDIPNDAIPWAIPDIQFLGSTCGNFIVPVVNSIVKGYFDKGDIQKPIYDSLAFNKTNIDNSIVDHNEDYPFKMTFFQTDEGDYLTLNRSNGEFAYIHRTGASLIFKADGNIEIDTGVSDENEGSLTITVNGDTEINTTGKTSIYSYGDVTLDSLGKVTLGRNPAAQLANNLPNCPICGIPLQVGNTNVYL